MHERSLIVVGTAVAYGVLFVLNDLLFGSLRFSETVNLIYLPSGLRLAFVLIFVEWGAVGIALASMGVSSFMDFNGGFVSAIGSGVISGFAPYLARYACHHELGMDLNLKNLTTRKLIAVSVVFAVMSASMHQMFYTWRGHTKDFVTDMAVMALGDWVGTIIMLYLTKLVLSSLRRKYLRNGLF